MIRDLDSVVSLRYIVIFLFFYFYLGVFGISYAIVFITTLSSFYCVALHERSFLVLDNTAFFDDVTREVRTDFARSIFVHRA